MSLKLYIRQKPIFQTYGFPIQEIHYEGANPQSLNTVNGGIPPGARQWQNYGQFIDITDYVNLEKLTITFTVDRDTQGLQTPGSFNPKKTATGQLQFERLAYTLVKSWLVNDVSAALNLIEVKIQDTACGYYEGFVIQPKDLSWCESDICVFSVTMKQLDEQLLCIQRTFITDNWQGWFQKVPAQNKKHPRFSYCNEIRPNGTLTMEWYLLTSLVGTFGLLFIAIVPLVNSIIFAINTSIIAKINAIISVINNLGGNVTPLNYIAYISLNDFFDGISTMYIESSGCGREHPAALIRDYITNVCDKCGVKVNATTAPILFSPSLSIETSGRGIQNIQNNPYYNACYLNIPIRRGLRRFRRASIISGFQDANNEYWIPDNDPQLYLDMFLDKIKVLFNAEWRLINGYLYFNRKDFFLANNYVYDFSENGSDRPKILLGVCYEPNDQKYPASCTGIYTVDAADSCGMEAGNVNGTGQMNGTVDFCRTDTNPNYSGILLKDSEFGATKFRFDGASTDYIYDALQVIMNGGAFSASQIPGITFTVLQQVAQQIDNYAAYALILSGDNAAQPKILLWDGVSYENAKTIRPKAAWDGVAPQPMPDMNLLYNGISPFAAQSWKVRHNPQTDTIGRGLTFSASPNGIYRVEDLIGNVVTERPALLVNYPMYFEPYYLDTLWDYFHWLDDPRRNPKMNINWHVRIPMCCADMVKLGVLSSSATTALLQRVKLPNNYYMDGVLKQIELIYDVSDEFGLSIELSGEL